MNRDNENRKESNRNIITILKGVVIGGTMLVPGVSGGSMAMILGIYDQLISSVSSFMKSKRKSFLFLILFAAGGSLGMFLFSRPILHLIESFPMPTLYFFMGAVAGGVPMIFGKSKLNQFSWRGIFYMAAGFIIVTALSMLPAGQLETELSANMKGIVFLIAAGFVAAVALVLPGISVSYLLLVLGLYDETMKAISQLYMPFLIPLGAGLILGIFSTSRILENAMNRHPQPTYLMILGFVLGSVTEVFPGIPSGMEIIICIITLLAGFGIIMALSRMETD